MTSSVYLSFHRDIRDYGRFYLIITGTIFIPAHLFSGIVIKSQALGYLCLPPHVFLCDCMSGGVDGYISDSNSPQERKRLREPQNVRNPFEGRPPCDICMIFRKPQFELACGHIMCREPGRPCAGRDPAFYMICHKCILTVGTNFRCMQCNTDKFHIVSFNYPATDRDFCIDRFPSKVQIRTDSESLLGEK